MQRKALRRVLKCQGTTPSAIRVCFGASSSPSSAFINCLNIFENLPQNRKHEENKKNMKSRIATPERFISILVPCPGHSEGCWDEESMPWAWWVSHMGELCPFALCWTASHHFQSFGSLDFLKAAASLFFTQ